MNILKFKYITILLHVLFCSCQRQTFDDPKISSPIPLCDGGILLGNIDDDKLAVFLSSSTPSTVSGHSFVIDGNDNDTVAFNLTFNDSEVVFEQNGKSNKYRIVELNTDEKDVI